MFLMPASSLRSAASLASSVSYLDWPGVALAREADAGGFGVSEIEVLDAWAFFWSRREGDAKRSSVSESDRCKSFICELTPLEGMLDDTVLITVFVCSQRALFCFTCQID